MVASSVVAEASLTTREPVGADLEGESAGKVCGMQEPLPQLNCAATTYLNCSSYIGPRNGPFCALLCTARPLHRSFQP